MYWANGSSYETEYVKYKNWMCSSR
jgi:hypothetical protein